MKLKLSFLVLFIFGYVPLILAADLPNELFGVTLGSNVAKLNGVADTNAYQTVSFIPTKIDERFDVFWASHNKENIITEIHSYKVGMKQQECLILRNNIVNEYSKKYGIEFKRKIRKSGSEYLFSESKEMAVVIDCRDKGTRLRLALAKKRKK